MRNVLYRLYLVTSRNRNHVLYFRTYHDALKKFNSLKLPYVSITKLVDGKFSCIKKEIYRNV